MKSVPDDFKLTVIAKVRHGLLWDAVRKLGSQKALAEYLGVNQRTVSQWLRLQHLPPGAQMKEKHKRYKYNVAELEKKLLVLLGASLDDIFPIALAGSKLAKEQLEQEREMFVPMQSLLNGVEPPLALPPAQEAEIFESERHEALESALQRLTPRMEKIIRMRFGLEGEPKTFDEIGRHFGVTASRIQVIAHRALRRLRKKGSPILSFGVFED